MRQWLVDPKLLCSKHLYGEHVEHHMFVGSINKGVSVDGYIWRGLLCPELLHQRHEELVEEILRRGGNHKSPLPSIDWEMYARNNRYETSTNLIDVKGNLQELQRRCEVCRGLQEEGNNERE